MSEQNIFYTDDFEILLKEEGEKSEVMGLIHNQSSQKFKKYSNLLNIPVIVLSSCVGFLSAVPFIPYQSYVLGSVSILIAILKTIDSYYGFSTRSETHRMVSLNYNKISRLIQVQLSLDRECRIPPQDLYNLITHNIQNLKDSEPDIPDDIILWFKKKYDGEDTNKPNICNGLTNIKIHEHKPIEKKDNSTSPDNFDVIEQQMESTQNIDDNKNITSIKNDIKKKMNNLMTKPFR